MKSHIGSSHRLRFLLSILSMGILVVAQQPQTPGNNSQPSLDYLRTASLTHKMLLYRSALGDRFDKPGKERVVLLGSLTKGNSPPVPISILRDIKGNARLDDQSPNGRSLGFDGLSVWSSKAPVAQDDLDLMESIQHDTVETLLFAAQKPGTAIREEALRAKTEGIPGRNYYDVYIVRDTIQFDGKPHLVAKTFLVDSDTQLLDRVTYKILRNGVQVRFDTRIAGWLLIGGQRYPAIVERFQSGVRTHLLNFSTASTLPNAIDDSFKLPVGGSR